MYIRKIHILNIRSYDNTQVELSRGINLILGANNSGKSTILKCLQKLQSSSYQLDYEDIRKTETSGKLYIEIADIATKEHPLFLPLSRAGNQIPKNLGVLIQVSISPNKTPNEFGYIVDPTEWQVKITDKDIQVSNKKTGIDTTSMPAFAEFPAMETDNNFIYHFLSRRKKHTHTSVSGQQESFLVTTDLRNLPSKIKNLSNPSHTYHKDFVRYCNDILGFLIGNVPSKQNTNEEKVGIFVGNETIYLDSMGEGVANILGLLSVLLTENNKLFLIEEIENDIHPEALKKLLNFILEKSKNNQFIISTHSNIVLKYLATAENAKVFYTEIGYENIDKSNLSTSSIKEIKNTPQERLEALEKLGYDLFDFDLFKSYILFEESSAERIIRDFLIPEFVPELLNVVKTIGAKGADSLENYYEDFLRLFVYLNGNPIYDKKVWVIADGDDAGRDNIEKLRVRYPNFPKDNFIAFSKNNFEEYYPTQFRSQFEEIKKIQDRKKRHKEKIQLTNSVIDWINTNRQTAKKEFRSSAKDVIDTLKKISAVLIKKKKAIRH